MNALRCVQVACLHVLGLLGAPALMGCTSGGTAAPTVVPADEEAASANDEAPESLELTRVLPVKAQVLYNAWIDGEQHAAFTGSPATGEPRVGSAHTAWGGYISGEILELQPSRRIVMSWRTKEFPEGSPDSRVELLFEETDEGVRLTIVHTDIPAGQGGKYEAGWDGHYFEPIVSHYGLGADPGDGR